MTTTLRVALAYFSFAGLQRRINWICFTLMGLGFLAAQAAGSRHTASLAMGFAQFGVVVLAFVPIYSGGALLRAASTPSTLHLRPHGRRQILLGTTLAILMIAALFALFAAVDSITPLHVKRIGADSAPPLVVFRFVWGSTALLWVVVFALSSRPLLLNVSIGLIGMLPLGLLQLRKLPYSAEQIATTSFAIGMVAWTLLCFWYLRTASIRRPSFMAALAGGQSQPDFSWLDPGRWFRRSATAGTVVSGASAASTYFAGGNLVGLDRTGLLLGTVIALTVLVASRILIDSTIQLQPAALVASIFPIISWSLAVRIAPAARLLWLRSGLNRAGLFRAAERLMLRATLAFLSIPTLVFGTMGIIQKPDLAMGMVLHMTTAAALAICLLYVGLATTQLWSARTGVVFIGMIPATVAIASLKPDRAHSLLAQLIVLLVFSAAALTLRRFAKQVWLTLDWRLTRPPLLRGSR